MPSSVIALTRAPRRAMCDIHHFVGELSYARSHSRATCARVAQRMRWKLQASATHQPTHQPMHQHV